MKSKLKLFIVLLIIFSFAISVNPSNIEAKSHTVRYNKVRSYYKYPGNAKSKWTTRKKTWYSNKTYKTKYRKKYEYVKRNSSKRYTYKGVNWYYKGGKKLSQIKRYQSWSNVNGKWTYKYYRLAKYNTSGKMYYNYYWNKRVNGKLSSKTILSNGVYKRYLYDIKGSHYQTMQLKSGKWVIIWKKPANSGAPNKNLNNYKDYKFRYNGIEYNPVDINIDLNNDITLKYKTTNNKEFWVNVKWFLEGKVYDFVTTTRKVEQQAEDKIIALTNAHRKRIYASKYGAYVNKLMLNKNDILMKAARIRSAEIKEYFEHVRPNGNAHYTAATELGYPENNLAENIAADNGDYDNGTLLFNGWVSSPGHRNNIEQKTTDQIGVGVFIDLSGSYGVYGTMLFGDLDKSNHITGDVCIDYNICF